MHISEGILPVKQVFITSLVAAPLAVSSALSLRKTLNNAHTLPATRSFLTMAFAIYFAVTLLPVPVPVAGATSHMCATPLLALILRARFIPALTACLLLIQAIFFAHGGLSTLGANTLSLGVIGPSVTLVVCWCLTRMRVSEKTRLVLSCFLGSMSVYAADALILAWSFVDIQPFSKTFIELSLGFLPVQGPLSLLEAIVSAGVITRLSHQPGNVLCPPIAPVQPVNLSAGLRAATGFVSAVILGFSASQRAYGASYEGLDDKLFVETAVRLGAKKDVLITWISGEVELAIFSLGFLVAGFIAGRAFANWRNQCRESILSGVKSHVT